MNQNISNSDKDTKFEYHEFRCDTCDTVIAQLLVYNGASSEDGFLDIVEAIFDNHMLLYKNSHPEKVN